MCYDLRWCRFLSCRHGVRPRTSIGRVSSHNEHSIPPDCLQVARPRLRASATEAHGGAGGLRSGPEAFQEVGRPAAHLLDGFWAAPEASCRRLWPIPGLEAAPPPPSLGCRIPEPRFERPSPAQISHNRVFNTWFFDRPKNRRFWESGRPRAAGKPSKKVGGFAPDLFDGISGPPGAAQTPTGQHKMQTTKC